MFKILNRIFNMIKHEFLKEKIMIIESFFEIEVTPSF